MSTTTISRGRPPTRDPVFSSYDPPARSHYDPPPSTTAKPSSRFDNYNPTTVSSYQRRSSNVEGLPDSSYFSSGRSKFDRRKEYITAPFAPSAPSSSWSSQAGRSAVGKELVKYSPRGNTSSRKSTSYDDDDDRTILPSDSISQVSYSGSKTSSSSRPKRRDSGYGSGSAGGGSTFSTLSTFQSQRVFDGTRQCYLVERRPRASALGR